MIYYDKKDNEKRKHVNRIKYKTRKMFSDNEELKKDIVLIVDNNEQVWGHIENKLIKNGFAYVTEHLKTGDYSFYYQGEYFGDRFAIERKNSLEELISSMLAPRFEREIRRSKMVDYYDFYRNQPATKINDGFFFEIMTEGGSATDLLNGNYKNDVDSQKIFQMYMSRKTEYNLIFSFIKPEDSFNYILSTIKYYLQNMERYNIAYQENLF